MSPKATIVLIFVFIGLGTLAVFDPLHWKDKKEEATQKENRVFWWPDAKSEWVELESNGQKIRLDCAEKDACAWDSTSSWKITAPVSEAADSANVGNFLNALKNLTPVEHVDLQKEGANLAEYGLDKPKQEIHIKLTGHANPINIKIGNASAIGESLYLYSDASPQNIFLVANYLPDLAKKSLLHWRDKRLFPGVAGEVATHLAWEDFGKKHSFAFEKSKDGFWVMTHPLSVPANEIMISGLMSTVAYTAALQVVEPKDAKLGKQVLKIDFKDKGGKAHTLSLYAKQGAPVKNLRSEEADIDQHYYARSSDREWLTEVDALPFVRFQKELSEYRTPHLISAFEKNLAQELEFNFARDKKVVTVNFNGSAWKYKSGEPVQSLAHARVKTFFDGLAALEAKGFEANTSHYQAWKKSPGDLILTMRGGDGKIVRVLKFVVIDSTHIAVDGERGDEVRIITQADFIRSVPVRLADLEFANNQAVVHQAAPGKDPHAGHNH